MIEIALHATATQLHGCTNHKTSRNKHDQKNSRQSKRTQVTTTREEQTHREQARMDPLSRSQVCQGWDLCRVATPEGNA